ncbi:MAG: DNA-binding response regulator [Deltaproteobacteria bacterium CG2_30_63_29]|nr:MAG: DNA-binding response regulator [Deltaproteobacteria bacterium CG2_30_63_29]
MTDPQSVLVVDDDAGHLKTLEKVLTRDGFRVFMASTGQQALDCIRESAPDLVVTDLMMPGMSGVDLLKAAKTLQPSVEVIVMTAFGTVERAVDAMKEGAYDFIEKPIKRAALLKSARRALERKALVAENNTLRKELDHFLTQREIVGRSERIRRVLELVRQVAPTQTTVLILGASGTGKELVARALHRLSPRSSEAFITVNCAALPSSILESELFGHEKGAFTGAHQRKLGRFELANHGTLFLDEIGELPLDMQSKLLRVLQEGELERVGGTKAIQVDVRIVAATNKNLQEEVRAGRFRDDLFYRLNVIAVDLPSLAERREDIVLLAEHFLRHFVDVHKLAIGGYTRAALEALSAHDWPGNVRELKNVVERAVVLCKDNIIDLADLPAAVLASAESLPGQRNLLIPLGTPLEAVKRQVILETLQSVKGDKRLAAQLLGIATRTIYRLLEEEQE